ncbi:MAG: BPL-N domain-containing protein [bacterium]
MRFCQIRNIFFYLGKLALILLIASACNGVESADIALYSDNGADENCITATKHMFEWMGYSVALIEAETINKGELVNYKLLCVPGGDMYQYGQDISSSGKQNIRDFVAHGGAYIGICGGAYFTGHTVYWQGQQLPMTPLNLFPGTTRGPVDSIAPYPNCIMCRISIIDTIHPITHAEPDSAWIAYCYGPQLEPDIGVQITVLGEYSLVGTPAIIAFEYDKGRVFIVGTHPEFEEDSDRDGVDAGDSFDDKGSDWNLMRNAVLWCLT